MKDTKLADILIEAIEKGPKWVPAIQNRRKVTCWKTEKLTFRLPEDKVIEKITIANSDTKILSARGEKTSTSYVQKYIQAKTIAQIKERNIHFQKYVEAKTKTQIKAENGGRYEEVKFIVDKEGSIHEKPMQNTK